MLRCTQQCPAVLGLAYAGPLAVPAAEAEEPAMQFKMPACHPPFPPAPACPRSCGTLASSSSCCSPAARPSCSISASSGWLGGCSVAQAAGEAFCQSMGCIQRVWQIMNALPTDSWAAARGRSALPPALPGATLRARRARPHACRCTLINSPLATNVTGQMKDILTTALGMVIFGGGPTAPKYSGQGGFVGGAVPQQARASLPRWFARCLPPSAASAPLPAPAWQLPTLATAPMQTSSTRRSMWAASCWACWARVRTRPSAMQRARPRGRPPSRSGSRCSACRGREQQPAEPTAASWHEGRAGERCGSRLARMVEALAASGAAPRGCVLPAVNNAGQLVLCYQCSLASADDLC